MDIVARSESRFYGIGPPKHRRTDSQRPKRALTKTMTSTLALYRADSRSITGCPPV